MQQVMNWPLRAAVGVGIGSVSEERQRGETTPGQAGPSGGDLVGLGLVIAGAFVLPLLLGIGVDALVHSGPIATVIGLFVGIGAAAYTAVVRFRSFL